MIYVLGGGENLNFKVVGGTTEPSNPKENTIWVNTDTAITSWDFSATEPNRRSGNKNLIVHPFYNTTMTINGVTITDNGDGTLTLNGTCTANGDFRLSHSGVNRLEFILQPGTYQVSGNANSSESSHHVKVAYSYDNWATAIWGGSDGKPFVVEKEAKARANLTILKGATFSNLVYKPQLEKGSSATSFVKGDATGQVWFGTDTSSSLAFNALKKDNLTVYPNLTKQYVNGAWGNKTVKIYQNGALEDLIPIGTIFDTNYGGIVDPISVAYQQANASVTIASQGITYVYSSTGNAQSGVISDKLYDITDFNTLVVEATISGIGGSKYEGRMGVAKSKWVVDKFTFAAQTYFTANNTRTVYELDVSSLGGEYYVGTAGGLNGVIHKIQLI